MKPLSSRWRIKGKLRLVLILLFTSSMLFMSYQLLYYASLNQYQSEESEAQLRYRHNVFDSSLRRDQKLKGEPVGAGVHIKPPAKLDSHDLSVVKEGRTKRVYQAGKPISSSVLGVAPEYWSRYTSKSLKFTCFTSKTFKISWDRVNDDYCDCPFDGSDEPSTSACMNGKFYCTKSNKSYPEYVPSSRVNDGICDCCDGSDEYLAQVPCKSSCL